MVVPRLGPTLSISKARAVDVDIFAMLMFAPLPGLRLLGKGRLCGFASEPWRLGLRPETRTSGAYLTMPRRLG
jgi:hypothetical protein